MPNIVNGLGQIKVGVKPTPPPTLGNGLYSVYNADNNTNDSFGSRNGTAMGGLTYTTGKIGQAFQFNGTTSYVDIGDNFDIGTSSWSYSLWFKNDSTISSQTLFAKSYSGAAVGRFFATLTTGNELRFSLETTSGSVLIIRTGTIVPLSTWNHVVYVVDRNDKIKIYLNGSLITPITVSGTNNLTPFISTNFNNIYPFRIGSNTASNGTGAVGVFTGQIDAFNVWDKALTQSEITELYNYGNGKQYPF